VLPVITYPLQAYALPVALIGAALIVLALIFRKLQLNNAVLEKLPYLMEEGRGKFFKV